MRKLAIFVLMTLLPFACRSKPEVRYDPDRKEHETHAPPPPASVPQAGVDALKDIKKIKKQEDEKLKEDQKVLNQVDNQ